MDGRKKDTTADRKLDEVLDEALSQTFPASDPFSVGQATGTEPPMRPVDRKAPEVASPAGPGAKKRQGAARRKRRS